MKLNKLTNIINYSFDFADNDIDATFYLEIEDILPEYAKQIEVKQINNNYIICDFSKFIRTHKTIFKNYIYDNYHLPWASQLYTGLKNNYDEAMATIIEEILPYILQK